MYEVRITNGRTSKEGRVEVKIADEWNVICGDEWTIFEAMVVCRQIGMEYAQNALQVFYLSNFLSKYLVIISESNCHITVEFFSG